MEGLEVTSLNQELYAAVTVLEHAIEMHTEWLSRLHEHLICKQAVSDDVVHKDAHQLCALGKWYYSGVPEILKGYDEFSEIEKVHKNMHDCARDIAKKNMREFAVEPAEYRKFTNSQQALLHLFSNLKEKILLSAHSFDELTGAVRREAFSLLAANAHAEAERYQQAYCIAMIDIDYFKMVNDAYGHIVGDEVLKTVARNINLNTRKTDVLCRFGGEEFLLLLPKTTLAQSSLVADKLRKLVEELVVVTDEKQTISVTVSIGLAQWENGSSFDKILERADQKLYSAKDQGRNKVVA